MDTTPIDPAVLNSIYGGAPNTPIAGQVPGQPNPTGNIAGEFAPDSGPMVRGMRGGGVRAVSDLGTNLRLPNNTNIAPQPYQAPDINKYIQMRAAVDGTPDISKIDEKTLMGYATDYANAQIPAYLDSVNPGQKLNKDRLNQEKMNFLMEFHNRLPTIRGANTAPSTPVKADKYSTGDLLSGEGKNLIGNIDVGLANIVHGLPALGNEAVAASNPIGAMYNVLQKGSLPKPFDTNAVSGVESNLREQGEANLPTGAMQSAAEKEALASNPLTTTVTGFAGGALPYVLAGTANPLVGGAVMATGTGGQASHDEAARVMALPESEISKLPAYQQALQQTKDPVKAKQVVANASADAAQQVGQIFGAVMGSVGGGALTKPVQSAIAKVVGENAFKRALASGIGEATGFSALGAGQQAAQTEATNAVTGENREADLSQGFNTNAGLGFAFGALGGLVHGAKPGEEPAPSPKPTAEGVKSAPETPHAEAYNEAAASTLANKDTSVAPNAPPEDVNAALVEAQRQFIGHYRALNEEATPEQLAQATAQFATDWREKNKVPEPTASVKETENITPEEAANIVKPENAPEPEVASGKSEAANVEPMSVEDLIIQKGVNRNISTGVAELAANYAKEKQGIPNPSPEDINNLAAQIYSAHDVDPSDHLKSEALGALLAEKPEEPITAEQISARAEQMKNPFKKGSAATAAQMRAKAFAKADEAANPKAQANPLPKTKPKPSPKAQAAEQGSEAAIAANLKEKINENAPHKGRSVENVRSELGEKWGNDAIDKLEKAGVLKIVPDESHLPPRAMEKGYTVKGFYDGKSGYLVAKNLERGEALGALLHEVGTHYGLRRMLGGHSGELYQSLEKYVKDRLNSDSKDAETAEIKAAHERAIAGKPGERILINETIAHMMDKYGDVRGSIWERAVNQVKAFLFKTIGKHLTEEQRQKLINNDVINRLVKGATKEFKAPIVRDVSKIPAFSRSEDLHDWQTLGTEAPKFKNWFGKSKVVDNANNPVVMYHGTAEDFHTFDPDKLLTASGHDTSPLGFHFTANKAQAQKYAENASKGTPADERVIAAHLKIENPYEMSLDEAHDIESPEQALAFKQKLEAQGYDGIHNKDTGSWIAFKSSQVKSLENSGEFGATGNIYFSRVPTGLKTVQDIHDAWNPAKEPDKDEIASQKSVKLTATLAKHVNSFYPLQKLNRLAEKAGVKITADKNIFLGLTNLGGKARAEVSTDAANYIAPAKAVLLKEALKLGFKGEDGFKEFLGHVNDAIAARHALDVNMLMHYMTARLSDAAEAARLPLLRDVFNGKLASDKWLSQLKKIVNAPGAIIEKGGVDAGSGISDIKAHQLIAMAKKAGITDEVANRINAVLDPIRRRTLERGVESGNYTPEQQRIVQAYGSKWYLPFKGFAEGESIGMDGNNRYNNSFNKDTTETREGRTTQSRSPLDNLFSDAATGGKDVAYNWAAKKIFKAASNPKINKLLGGVNIEHFDINKLTDDALANSGRPTNLSNIGREPNSIIYKNGKDWFVMHFPEGSQELKAIKSIDDNKQLEGLNKIVAHGTNFIARGKTAFSPVFTLYSALARDITGYPILASLDHGVQVSGSYLKNLAEFGGPFGAYRTYSNLFRGINDFGAMEKMAKENPDSFAGWAYRLSKAGGSLDFKSELNSFMSSAGLAKQMAEETKNPLSDPIDLVRKAGNFLDSLATSSIATGRVTMFKSLVENGLNEEEAAHYVKRMENFEQTSEGSRQMNAWFPFWRAGVANSQRMYDLVHKPNGDFDKAKFGKIVALGISAAAAYWHFILKQYYGDDANKLKLTTLSQNFVIPNPYGDPIKIPMGLGIPRLMFGLGIIATRAVEGGEGVDAKSVYEATKQTLAENLTPLKPTEGQPGESAGDAALDLIMAAVPGIGRPLADLARNRNDFGGSIHSTPEFTESKFHADEGWRSTPPIWKDIAIGLRHFTGADVYPESLEYLANSYGQGYMTEALRGFTLKNREEGGEETGVTDVPFVPRFTTKDIQYATTDEFRAASNVLQNSAKEAKELKDNKQPIPQELQQKINELKKFATATRVHNKELKAIEDVKGMDPQIRADRLRAVNDAYKAKQNILIKEIQSIGEQ